MPPSDHTPTSFLPSSSGVITHALSHSSHATFLDVLERLKTSPQLVLSHKETLRLAFEMVSFPLGQFLIANRGLNGRWIANLILQENLPHDMCQLEVWIRHKAPVVLATRERFYIFRREIKRLLKDDMVIASVPCGLMESLLQLHDARYANIKFVGIDLDPQALELTALTSNSFLKQGHLELRKQDAWHLDTHEEFDVLLSNGLNIYEADQKRLQDLFYQFAQALKKRGSLITSFLTPPLSTAECPWRDYNAEDVRLQQAVFYDIANVKWQCYVTESHMQAILQKAGFVVRAIHYDRQAMFPTVVAQKVD